VLAADAPVIVGCSALRRAYRDRLRAGAGGPVQFVHLAGRRELLAKRMSARTGHYMPLSLLDTQLAALEPPSPDEALTIDIDQTLDAIITTAAKGIRP
jgi:gluconokinase